MNRSIRRLYMVIAGGFGLLVLMLVRPLGAEQALARPLLIAAAAALLIGGGLSIAAQVMEPMVAAKTA